jgi:ATP-binding cassette subfamily F protein 3
VAQKRSRQARKEQRRKEAELRAKQNQGVKPLEKRVGEIERTIARLEQVIAEHNQELSKPEVYDDAERRDTLLREVQEAQTDLDRSFAEWTESNEKLEQLRAEIEAAG